MTRIMDAETRLKIEERIIAMLKTVFIPLTCKTMEM